MYDATNRYAADPEPSVMMAAIIEMTDKLIIAGLYGKSFCEKESRHLTHSRKIFSGNTAYYWKWNYKDYCTRKNPEPTADYASYKMDSNCVPLILKSHCGLVLLVSLTNK